MLLLTLVLGGVYPAMIHGSGLVAAHLHYFLTDIWPTYGGGTNILKTPAFMERLFATVMPQVLRRAYGTAFHPSNQPSRGTGAASTGTSSAVLPESWKSRGTGHRLGGD